MRAVVILISFMAIAFVIIFADILGVSGELAMICTGQCSCVYNLSLQLDALIECHEELLIVVLRGRNIIQRCSSTFIAYHSVTQVSYLVKLSVEAINELWSNFSKVFNDVA